MQLRLIVIGDALIFYIVLNADSTDYMFSQGLGVIAGVCGSGYLGLFSKTQLK